MPGKKSIKILLIGNPNSGKSSLFNQLTGLNQKIGNYPGITVDKKSGYGEINDNLEAEIIDLPGTYSIYPRSEDERVVFDTLWEESKKENPSVILAICDSSNLNRNLLLFTQVRDMGLPMILALNMIDVARKSGISINSVELAATFNIPVVEINARNGEGIEKLKKIIAQYEILPVNDPLFNPAAEKMSLIQTIQDRFHLKNSYLAWLAISEPSIVKSLNNKDATDVGEIIRQYSWKPKDLQSEETIKRYSMIRDAAHRVVTEKAAGSKFFLSEKIDRLVTHKFWGYIIFFIILFLIFQTIYSMAKYPMDGIDWLFTNFGNWLNRTMPQGALTDLLSEGIIPGLGGILVFIPQIALLFAFISLLEESGYMARVVFLMDKIMRKFGLNGRSIVPLMSGVACAIPAIMATRSIENWKDRLTTIFVIPLMSCSARLPVYTVLIALVVPEQYLLGMVNLQGLTLMGLYLLGFMTALFSALMINVLLKRGDKSFLIMELPLYKMPRWKNVGLTIWEKSGTFAFQAGKVILAISIILWVLASYGPAEKMRSAEKAVREKVGNNQITEKQFNSMLAAYKLENSYAGTFGKFIEPVIRPLGFDWKIGIALITSFAAREVFVATMVTIYSIEADEEDAVTIRERLKSEVHPETGQPFFTPAVGFSLIIFYVFAMQCMSTLAVVFRETKRLKWPLLQLLYMSSLAYLSAFLVYNLLS